mgnify:CR=1 FL=1
MTCPRCTALILEVIDDDPACLWCGWRPTRSLDDIERRVEQYRDQSEMISRRTRLRRPVVVQRVKL